MYLFDGNNSGIIPNNSVILTNNFGQLPQLRCISGSKLAGVGQWFTPSGHNITSATSDPFDVIVGGENDPGYSDLLLHHGMILTMSDQGIYVCHIPDETGMISILFAGLYLPALTGTSCALVAVVNIHVKVFSALVFNQSPLEFHLYKKAQPMFLL